MTVGAHRTVPVAACLGDVATMLKINLGGTAIKCQHAAAQFPFSWEQKAQAFRKAAEDLGLVQLQLSALLDGHLPRQAFNLTVEFEASVPRPRRDLPKWVVARDTAAALRAVAALGVHALGCPELEGLTPDVLGQAAHDVEAITFPTLADHDWPKRSPLNPGHAPDAGPRVVPDRAT